MTHNLAHTHPYTAETTSKPGIFGMFKSKKSTKTIDLYTSLKEPQLVSQVKILFLSVFSSTDIFKQSSGLIWRLSDTEIPLSKDLFNNGILLRGKIYFNETSEIKDVSVQSLPTKEVLKSSSLSVVRAKDAFLVEMDETWLDHRGRKYSFKYTPISRSPYGFFINFDYFYNTTGVVFYTKTDAFINISDTASTYKHTLYISPEGQATLYDFKDETFKLFQTFLPETMSFSDQKELFEKGSVSLKALIEAADNPSILF